MATQIIKTWQKGIEGEHTDTLLISDEVNLDKPLYRYMSADRVFNFLSTGKLMFNSPTRWTDPFEKRFLTADYSNIPFDKPNIHCCCFTQKATNEAAWQMYSYLRRGIEMRTIKLEFDTKLLLQSLAQNNPDNDIKIYVSNVSYLATQSINTLHKCSSPYYDQIFSSFDAEKFVDLMYLKRKAFEYENEVRILVLDAQNEIDPLPLRLDIKKEALPKLIKRIIFSPDCSNFETKILKDELQQILPDTPMGRSTLYTPKTGTITIERPQPAPNNPRSNDIDPAVTCQ